MICGNCGTKMTLKQVGIIAPTMGYECPNCGLRDGFHIDWIYENLSPELQNALDELSNIPIGPMKNKEEWLANFDALLDRQGITVYSRTKILVGEEQ